MDNTKHNDPEEMGSQEVNREEVMENTESGVSAEAEAAEFEEAADADLSPEEKLRQEVDELKDALEKEKKEYLFLMAEFDNYRKRTIKEKSEIIRNASEQAFKGLLTIVDDFERGLKASDESGDAESLKEGMSLIYNKLIKYMEQNGVKPMDLSDGEFNADRHEAIASVPAPSEDMKGKILDTVEKGYMINDKVLRHAKVVVGQ